MELKLKQKINKISAELRFRPKLASWENTLFLAQLFEQEFPDWQIDKGVRSNILLFSKENREYLKISFNSLSYAIENTDDLSKFRKFLKLVSDKFQENGIELFQAMDCRNLLFYETDLSHSELSEIIFEKFYGSQERLRSISSEKVRDVAFTLDGEKNGYVNNCRLGPMQKDQLLEAMKSAFEIDSSEIADSKTYLYQEIIISLLDPKFDNLKASVEILDGLVEENKRVTKEYLDLVKTVIK